MKVFRFRQFGLDNGLDNLFCNFSNSFFSLIYLIGCSEVKSLFTNIRMKETVDLCVSLNLFRNQTHIKRKKKYIFVVYFNENF